MQPDENFWKKCEGEQIANAYELEQLLGCGAFGGVFRAVQIANGRKLNKKVAVKLMLSGTIQQEELNFALDLPSHQNLVQHFAGNNVEIRGFPMFYLVMELADCSLADFVKKRGGKISSVEAKAIVRDIAQGLKYLHELDAGNSQDKRYVHRDLKLLNVLQVGGVWKIADFGLSKALDRGTMQASKIAGTPYYMPPELFRNGYVSTKWDVWSLGVMIVEMLTGHFPFEAGGNGNTEVVIKELERKIERENPNLQGVSSEWLDVVKGCLVKKHESRWTADRVLDESNSLIITQQPNTAIVNEPPKNRSQVQKIAAPSQTLPARKAPQKTKSPINFKAVFYTFVSIGMVYAGVMNRHLIPLIHGNILNTSGNKKDALAKYQEAISIKPDDSYAYFQSAYVKSELGDQHGAIADYYEAIRLKPDHANAYAGRGRAKYSLGDEQGAIADYNEAIRLKPDYADTYTGRAIAKASIFYIQEAIIDCNEAIRLKPDYAFAYFLRASLKKDLGDKQGAIADYNEAIRLEPDNTTAYSLRASLKKDLGDKQGVISDYNGLIRLDPNYANAYYDRGIAKSGLGDKQGAIADFNEAIRLNPNNPNNANAYARRGLAKYRLKDEQGAIADYNEAIRLKPNDADEAYYNRGIAKSGLGDKQGAIADFNEAIRLNPNYAEAYNSRGFRKKERGEKQEALTDFRKAAELFQKQGNIKEYNNSRDSIKELGGQ